MCYKAPGPRCTNHARKTLVKAESELRRFTMARMSLAHPETYVELKQKVDQAEQQFDATPGGQADLRRQIEEGRDMEGELQMRLDLGIARRKEMLAAVHSADKGDFHKGALPTDTSALKTLPSTFLPSAQPRVSWDEVGNRPQLEEALIDDSSAWMSRLTPEQQESVRWYTSNGAHVMNSYILKQKDEIFGDKYTPEQIEESIAHLDSAFEQYESSETRLVYRGLQEWNFSQEVQDLRFKDQEAYAHALEKDLDDKFPVGGTFSSPVHMSASLDAKSGLSFERMDVMMEIVTKKAAPVVSVSAWGISEREALVKRNTQFRVVAIKKDVPYRTMHWRTKEPHDRLMTVIQLEEVE